MVQNNCKERQKSVLHVLITSIDLDAIFIADPFSITRFIFFVYKYKQSFAFSPG